MKTDGGGGAMTDADRIRRWFEISSATEDYLALHLRDAALRCEQLIQERDHILGIFLGMEARIEEVKALRRENAKLRGELERPSYRAWLALDCAYTEACGQLAAALAALEAPA